MKKPSEEIREIWQEMKEMKWLGDNYYGDGGIKRLDELREKYEEIDTLFGHESTLSKAIIYYLDKK